VEAQGGATATSAGTGRTVKRRPVTGHADAKSVCPTLARRHPDRRNAEQSCGSCHQWLEVSVGCMRSEFRWMRMAPTDRLSSYLVDASHHSASAVAAAPEVCGHTEPHATQNSFPSGSCITTKYRCRVLVSTRTGWSTVAPRSTSSATLASTVATISSIGPERSAT
jgi:hypothetical protein